MHGNNIIRFPLLRTQHKNSKATFQLKDYALPCATTPLLVSPPSSPEPTSSPNSQVNGKIDVANQASTMSTAAALSKMTNFSIAAIMHQQNQHKLRQIDTSDTEDELRAKRRRLEASVPSLGRRRFT